MELLYVWIERYRNIEKQGFNFSPRWRFDYNPETGFLDIEDRYEQVIDNFFGKRISNVTAIVGANGSGKTTLMSFLAKIINKPDQNAICIFLIECEITLWNLPRNNRIIDFDKKYQVNIQSTRNKIRGAYLSHCFNGRSDTYPNSQHIFDLSINYLFSRYELLTQSSSNIPPSHIFRILEVKRQAKLIADFSDFGKGLQFQIPSFLELKINNENDSKELIKQLERNNQLTEVVKAKIQKINVYLNPKDFIEKVKATLCFYVLITPFRVPGGEEVFYSLLDDFISNIDEQRQFQDFQFTQDWPLEVSCLPKLVNFLSEKITLNEEREDYLLPVRCLETFFGLCADVGWAETCFDFDWRFGKEQQYGSLSGGEEHLINIFARIYEDNITRYPSRPIIIFLDEAELGLHPEWQRKFLDILIKNLPEILLKAGKIQIILSTHSPFILSDLPKENVIFLDKDEEGRCKVHDGLKDKKQSFGANIHTLLSDGFFMDSLIGEFAKGKIDKVIKFLNNQPTDLIEEEAQKIINMIGEPILQRELQRRMKLRSVDALKTQVADLEARIKELENKDQ